MRLAGIRAGDVVQVDGRLAFVERVRPGELVVRHCHGSRGLRVVRPRDVEAHWRKRAGS